MNATPSSLRALTRSVPALAALASAALVIALAETSSAWLVVLAIGFAGWAASPYVLLWATATWWTAGTGPLAIVLGGAIAMAGFAVWVYYQGFVAHPDPQSGLLLLFVPAYQWMAAAIVTVVSVVWSAARRSR